MKRRGFLVFLTLAVAMLIAGCQAGMSEGVNNTMTSNTNTKTEPSPAAATPTDDAPRISVADAKAAFDAGDAFFIDTRAAANFEAERIKGAINMTQDQIASRIGEIPKDKKIIAYCSWPAEHTSASLVSELKRKGFNNGHALVGGTQAWKNVGHPMETGK